MYSTCSACGILKKCSEINVSHKSLIKFESGKYAGQVWKFDFSSKSNWIGADTVFKQICVPCLEVFVENGSAKIKQPDMCTNCQISDDNLYEEYGRTLDQSCEVYLGFGSVADGDLYSFPRFIPSKFYCYTCLDKEITDKDAILVKEGVIMSDDISNEELYKMFGGEK